jgi:hypothetical protein
MISTQDSTQIGLNGFHGAGGFVAAEVAVDWRNLDRYYRVTAQDALGDAEGE